MSSRKRLVIFPSKKQIELLQKSDLLNAGDYIVVRANALSPRCGATVINADDIGRIAGLSNKRLAVLCCDEEALYWAKVYQGEEWTFSYSKKCFSCLTKLSFKKFISSLGIQTAELLSEISETTVFPIVAKPTIGFASIGVKTISSYADYLRYHNEFKREIDSVVQKYVSLYFCQDKNFPIFEEYIVGDFFRTPIIIHRDYSIDVFPVRGITTEESTFSDYHWVDFYYNDPSHKLKNEMVNLISFLSSALDVMAGVYVAEFIHNDRGLYLLEFSPRQTSEQISKIIRGCIKTIF